MVVQSCFGKENGSTQEAQALNILNKCLPAEVLVE